MSEIPENLSYTKDHEWASLQDDGKVKVGITDHAQDALSDVVFVELPDVGSEFVKGDAMAASDIYAPVSGKIISINDKLEESPELINESPYEFGWMVVIEPEGDLEGLLDSNAYREVID